MSAHVEVRVEAKGGRAWVGNGDSAPEALANLLEVLESYQGLPPGVRDVRKELARIVVPWAGERLEVYLVRRALQEEHRMIADRYQELQEQGATMSETIQAVEADRPEIREAARARVVSQEATLGTGGA